MKKNYFLLVVLAMFITKVQAQPTIAAPNPPVRTSTNVISLFSGAYTDVAGTDWFPFWSQSTVVTEVSIAGNPTKKYDNFNYQGVQFLSPINAANMDSLHLNVWTTNCTSLDVFLINQSTNTEQKVTVIPTLSGWNSFHIALSQYTNINLSNIGQFKFVSTPFGGTVVYLDNIYFYKSTSSPTLTSFTIPAQLVGAAPFTLTPPTSNSTGAFTYTSSNTNVATISGNTVTVVGVGTSIITASQAAAAPFLAGSTTASLVVSTPPPTVAASTPPVRVPAQVISLFSGAYTDVAGTDWFPSWSQSTIVTEELIVGNPTKKYSNFNYQGVQLQSPINVTAMNYLHIDVWTPNCTFLEVFLINQSTNTEQKVTLSPSLSGWNSFDIALSQYNTINLSNVGQLKFVGTNGSTVYLDNIYFFFVAGIPPVVTLTAPANNAVLYAPTNITITANASDDGTVAKVEFYNGATLLGEALNSPYSFIWNGVTAGTYAIRAKATDNVGLSTTTAAANIIVSGPTGDGFCATSINGDYKFKAETAGGIVTYTMSPQSRITGCAYSLIYIKEGSGGYSGTAMTAVGTDFIYTKTIANGVVTNVYFTYQVPSGGESNSQLNPEIYTVGTNCTGLTGIPTVNITSPANNANFVELSTVSISANATATNTITKVEFFRGNTLVGTDVNSPYSFDWLNAPAGNYNLVAKVTDNANLTTFSAIVPIVVNINNSVGYCGTIANGDYSYRIETIGGNVVFTMIPLGAIVGSTYAFIYVREGLTGPYPGYAMTKIGNNFRFTKAIANTTPISVYFTYQVPAGGENTSLLTPHSYTVGTNCLTTVPVSLVNYSAKINGNNVVVVSWSTLNEVNNDYYIIEKSTDGVNFSTLQKVFGTNTINKHDYAVIDQQPTKGINYYRLTQVDKDGKQTIYGVKSVNFSGKNTILSIYPNPLTSNQITVQLDKIANKLLVVQLVDIVGRIVSYQKINQSLNTLTINFSNKPSKGVYLLKIEGYEAIKLAIE